MDSHWNTERTNSVIFRKAKGAVFRILKGISVGEVGRNLLHSGNFPEIAIGNSGTVLIALQITLPIRAEMVQPPKFEVQCTF